MIEIQNLVLGYGKHVLLDDVSLSVPCGKLTAVIGRNGSGKSTLLRALSGLGDYISGHIELDGHNLKGMSVQQLARIVACVTTERLKIANLRCRDIVALGRAPYTNWIGRMQDEDETIVTNSLRLVGMESYADCTMDKMSDGECQRIMIARALAQNTPIILLDEPTSFLDIPNRYELCALLANLAHKEGKCVVFSTHELDIALSHCDFVILINNPHLYYLPVAEMSRSGHIERLFCRSHEERAAIKKLLHIE